MVRRALLDSAAKIAMEDGLPAVTIQAVAKAANVTKGGLFHHFASKQALIEGMYKDILTRLDEKIDARMAKEDTAKGCFTRAYVATIFQDDELGFDGPLAAMWIGASADPVLRQIWLDWLNARLDRHRDTDNAPLLEVVRLAADGAWFSYAGLETAGQAEVRETLYARLVAMMDET